MVFMEAKNHTPVQVHSYIHFEVAKIDRRTVPSFPQISHQFADLSLLINGGVLD